MTKEERMKGVVKTLGEYMAAHDKQIGYEKYTDGIFIDDILYGIGIALDRDKYEYSTGFREFKKVLIKRLTEGLGEA